jgi:hypothetical protein
MNMIILRFNGDRFDFCDLLVFFCGFFFFGIFFFFFFFFFFDRSPLSLEKKMSLSLVVILSALAALTSAQTEITRSFFSKPKFTKLSIFADSKNASKVLLEAVETTSTSKTLYWVTASDIRSGFITKYDFSAKTSSQLSGATTILDSTVATSERGVAAPTDTSLAALLSASNDTNAFAPVLASGAPANKFLFKVDTDGTNDIVCLIAVASSFVGTDDSTLPAIACTAVVAGTLTPTANTRTPFVQTLDSAGGFSASVAFKIAASDLNFAGTPRFTSKQSGKCTNAPGSSISAGLIVLVPVTCNAAWKQKDGTAVKCDTGFKHAALELSVSYVADRFEPVESDVKFTGFVVAGKSEDAPGVDLPTVRVLRASEESYSSSSSADGAMCVFFRTGAVSLTALDGLQEPFSSGSLFPASATWSCPDGTCEQEDFDDASSSTTNKNSILDCEAAGLGVLACLGTIQSTECMGLSSFGGLSGGAMTAAPAPQTLTAAQCKCVDKLFQCLIDAGCKINNAARTAEQVMQCKMSCPDSAFCAASSISIHGATLLFAMFIATMMLQWN